MQNLKVQMEWLQWGFPIATALSLRMDPRLREDDMIPGLAKRRALFPAGRGLGVGRKKIRKKEKQRIKRDPPSAVGGLRGLHLLSFIHFLK